MQMLQPTSNSSFFGFKELEGIHSRTDFDLKAHQKYSNKKIQYFDPLINKSYTPYVIETSIGLDRMFLAVLSSSFFEEKVNENETRTVLKISYNTSSDKDRDIASYKKRWFTRKSN